MIKGECIALPLCGLFSLLLALGTVTDSLRADVTRTTVECAYPGLASGVLSYATLEDLPGGMLLRAPELEITSDDLESELSQQPPSLQDQLKKNAFFFLEQIAARKLLLQVARKHSGGEGICGSDISERDIINRYLHEVVSDVEVLETEVEDFYTENRALFGGAPLDYIRKQLQQYLLQQKQQRTIAEHARTLGQRVPISVSGPWLEIHALLARDNPVDRARASGTPTLVDFGATGCRPCDMMTPILSELRKKYEDKLNVLFVHVRKQQILAARYGIQGIPVQVFFDKRGKEVFRHSGFFPQDEIERKLKEMGVE